MNSTERMLRRKTKLALKLKDNGLTKKEKIKIKKALRRTSKKIKKERK